MNGPFAGRVAALATMHGKEAILAPVLERELGLRVVVPGGLDTDRFGTFSGERPRLGDQRRAAHAKAEAGLRLVPEATIAVASEGSFGPHPSLAWLGSGFEIVLLVDALRGVTIAGEDLTLDTDYEARIVTTADEAVAALRGVDPGSAVTISAADARAPIVGGLAFKGLRDDGAVAAAVARVREAATHAWVATDVRAHENARRRASIRRAADDLVRRCRSACPRCAAPGFWRDRLAGALPCADCGAPTARPAIEIRRCVACAYEDERAAGSRTAPARDCARCNP